MCLAHQSQVIRIEKRLPPRAHIPPPSRTIFVHRKPVPAGCDKIVRSTVASPSQPAIELRGITHTFGGSFTALKEAGLEADAGSFVAVVGPSGCGKSTLLNIAAGLLPPSQGEVRIFGQRLEGINRRAAYMFQQDALLPWKTVRENVALGLVFRGEEASAALRESDGWLTRVGLQGFGDSFPYQLSGGMRKRAAMAQCWITSPDIILMDEPFAALDVHTRMRMQQEVLDLWGGSGKTVLFITHELEEAIALADVVAVLSAGPESRIIAQHRVDLVRPRNLVDIRLDDRFQELYRNIWGDLRQEVLKSFARK